MSLERRWKKTIEKLQEILELSCQKDNKLHTQEVQKWGHYVSLVDGYVLNDDGRELKQAVGMAQCRNDLFERLIELKYNDRENMMYWMELTYDEKLTLLDINQILATTTGQILPAVKYERSDLT